MRARDLCFLFLVGMVAACSAAPSSPSSSSYNTGAVIIRNGVLLPPPSPEVLSDIMPAAGNIRDMPERNAERLFGVRSDGAPPGHCRLKDRFDRKEIIAYHFSDGQSKLGLDLDVDGPSLSGLGDFDVDAAFINFRYRLQPIKKRNEKCLYESGWQGLIGSGYNEFVRRETHTVYEELDEELNRAQRQLDDLLSYLP